MASRARRYPKKSSVLHVRIQPDTLKALKKAAERDGRTVSAQAEHELHRALSAMGGRTHAIFATIAEATNMFLTRVSLETGEAVEPARRKWWNDPRLFDQVARLCAAALELMRPPGAPPRDPIGDGSARFAIESTLHEIQTADPSVPFDKQKPHERWLNLMKRDLGDLADRPVLSGQTADQARALQEAAAPILAELIPLDKKRGKTPAELERQAELRRELERVVKPKQGRKRK